jgi:predicted HNH restriction endonuclease
MSKHALLADRNVCYFCGLVEPEKVKKGYRRIIEIHHIVERNQGGSNEGWNKVPCCSNCHSKIHLNIIKIDRWIDFGYICKLQWSDESGPHLGTKGAS